MRCNFTNTWESHIKLQPGNQKGKDHLGELGVVERMMVKWILNKNMEWLHLAQGRFQWRVLVKAVIKLQFHKNFNGLETIIFLKRALPQG
jgi:hypothetical protein